MHAVRVLPRDVTPRIIVIAAMRQELAPFARTVGLSPIAGRRPPIGRAVVGRVEVIAGFTTMGTGPASEFTERVLSWYRVDHVIGIGIAGGIGPSVNIGDLLVPEVVIDDETGAEYRPTPIDGQVPRGKLLTSDALISDKRGIDQLVESGVIAVDMETAAIGAACERHGVPWSVMRAISDQANDQAIDEDVLGLAHADGSADPAAIVRFVLNRPRAVPHLATLARGMTTAARVSAEAAARAAAHF